MADYTIHNQDCREAMAAMEANSIDAIVTDPPYFKVKGEAWDRQWDKPEQFLAWLGEIADEWARLLKPNGSLYCFASPRMAARVEVLLSERFNVLNRIVWSKAGEDGVSGAGRHRGAEKESLRAFFPATEHIIFAEHHGADLTALGLSTYAAKCDELRGFVFEPLRAYLADEWMRAGLTARDANEATSTQMAGHWFTRVQWALPTQNHYNTLRLRANATGGDYLRREYDDLRREYDDLRKEFESLRRPFSVTPDVPYTDVWTFKTVNAYHGKHPCEKPAEMMEHIIRASCTPGSVVLDPFMGSGTTGVAAGRLGMRFIGCELDADYAKIAEARIAHAYREAFPLASCGG